MKICFVFRTFRCGGEVHKTGSAEAGEYLVNSTTPFPTLKTAGAGKGKKVSRKSAIRREAAKQRWAKHKALLEENVKKEDEISLDPEQ